MSADKVTVRQIPERLMPDANYQFLIHKPFDLVFNPDKPLPADLFNPAPGDLVPPEPEQWFLYDSWGIEQACKLITIGYPVDLGSMAKEVKDWPPDCEGRDRFSTMVWVYSRALSIAKSSVNAGTIKEHDTPANWIKWAEGKGYSVAHLITNAPAEKVEAANTNDTASDAPKGDDKVTSNWILLVQAEAARQWLMRKKMNCSPTKNNIKNDLAKICSEKNIVTDYGIHPTADYIYRHVLRGWTPPTD